MQTSDVLITGQETFEGSDCQKSMQAAYAAGIDKIIVRDTGILNLTARVDGEPAYTYEELTSADFSNGIGLKKYINGRLKRYCYESGFYGVILADEPYSFQVKTHGLIYRTIKEVAEELGIEVYVHFSFLPFTATGFTSGIFDQTDGVNKLTYEQSYRKYLTDFITECGEYKPDDLCVDIYPYRGNATDVYDGYLANLQIFADVCKSNGIEMTVVLQSYADAHNNGTVNHAVVDEEMMRAQIATCLGLGVTKFAYYRYASTSASTVIDDGFFVNSAGETTAVYTAGQKVISESKALEKTILNYKYLGSNYYGTPTFDSTVDSLSATVNYSDSGTTTASYKQNTHEFALIESVTSSNDVVFVTELYDQANDLYMYTLQNFIDPRNAGDTSATITVDFGTELKIVQYKNGVKSESVISEGIYSVTLNAGEAVYIIPLGRTA